MYISTYEIKTSAMSVENFAFVAKVVTDEVAKDFVQCMTQLTYSMSTNCKKNFNFHQWGVIIKLTLIISVCLSSTALINKFHLCQFSASYHQQFSFHKQVFCEKPVIVSPWHQCYS